MPDGQNGQDKMPHSTTEDDITAAVLARFAATPDPRLRQIMLGSSSTCTPSSRRWS